MKGYDFYLKKEYEGSFINNSWFHNSAIRGALKSGLKTATYVPNNLHEAGTNLLALQDPDYYVGISSEMDAHGFLTVSLSATYEKDVIEKAKKFVLEVNKNAPRTHGDTQVQISQVDMLYEVDYPIPELPDAPPSETDERIAEHIAELVTDGSTLQIGIGGIPNAVAGLLKHKKNLGIHTEMFTESMIDLFEAGVITNLKKTLWPGKAICTFAMGSKIFVVVLFFPRGLSYALYIFQWKYLWRPYVWIRKKIRMISFKEEKAMFVKLGDIKIHYETGGNPSGEPIFMVHGNFASWRWFEPTLKRLKKSPFRGLAVDLPGFGDSSNPEREISIENYAKELESFINTFDLEKINLVGHSLGGAVCMKYALNNRDKINKLLLIDPAPADGLSTPEEYYPALESYRHNRGLLKQALSGMLVSGDPDKLLNKLTDDALLMDARAFGGNARALEKYNFMDQISELKCPVLFLVGEKDSLITEKLLQPTLDKLQNAKLKVLENVGHAVNVEDPDRFVKLMTEFFGGKPL